MAILIKNSIRMKAKIQMKTLGAVVLLYILLIISGMMTPTNRKSYQDSTIKSTTLIY